MRSICLVGKDGCGCLQHDIKADSNSGIAGFKSEN